MNAYLPSRSCAGVIMEVQPDFKEVLGLLNEHKVEYVIVGAYALEAFGFGSLGLTQKDFEEPDQVIQLGVQPVRIDLITSITGVSWDEAEAGKVAGKYGDIPVHYLGAEQYKANKRAVGRAKDLADLEALGEDGLAEPSP